MNAFQAPARGGDLHGTREAEDCQDPGDAQEPEHRDPGATGMTREPEAIHVLHEAQVSALTLLWNSWSVEIDCCRMATCVWFVVDGLACA